MSRCRLALPPPAYLHISVVKHAHAAKSQAARAGAVGFAPLCVLVETRVVSDGVRHASSLSQPIRHIQHVHDCEGWCGTVRRALHPQHMKQ